jgi:hypothetical protein
MAEMPSLPRVSRSEGCQISNEPKIGGQLQKDPALKCPLLRGADMALPEWPDFNTPTFVWVAGGEACLST